jgi:hypothetical protein
VSGAERSLKDVGCDVGCILAGHACCHQAEDSIDVSIENQSEPGGIAPGVLNDPTVGFNLKPHPIARLTDGRKCGTLLVALHREAILRLEQLDE